MGGVQLGRALFRRSVADPLEPGQRLLVTPGALQRYTQRQPRRLVVRRDRLRTGEGLDRDPMIARGHGDAPGHAKRRQLARAVGRRVLAHGIASVRHLILIRHCDWRESSLSSVRRKQARLTGLAAAYGDSIHNPLSHPAFPTRFNFG